MTNESPARLPTTRMKPMGSSAASDNSNALTNEEIRVRYPAHDFDGYWFFGGLRDSGEFTALMMGFSIGANDGYDWGFREVVPDPDFGLYVFQLIGPERSIGYGEQPIHRHHFNYDRRQLDVRLGSRLQVTIDPAELHYHMESDDGTISLDLDARMGKIVSWTPDMVLRGTAWTTFAVPDIEFTGEFRFADHVVPVDGIGTLDHPMGRNLRSNLSAGMGWWEYNCFMLNDLYGLFQWKIVDRAGETILARAVTNFPDGIKHLGSVELVYTEWENRESIQVPRAWDVVVHADHGVFRHSVRADGPPWDGVAHRRGDPLPNFALELDGTFEPLEGPTLLVEGRGTGETVISERDPYSNQPQTPW